MEVRTIEERSLGDLFSDLSRETSLLLRQEMELARVETSELISKMLRDSALAASGALIAYAGFLVLLGAAVYGLGTALPWWASALIIGGATLIVGLVLVAIGRSMLKNRSLKPRHTFESIKEDIQWAKRQAK
ncbi:MAG: phage holin family protein [Candidatus Abyssobacteria bacterium SURF_5]|uniref:Phage holin family protein n=1 Tax=Abyssobacteria bacterium (strain SURF_5) TaxID=2093360 RepID=A0A3A4NVJ5_ABYX5|nr:MAG: phage holin family protein [Candidatus Abyssubacteria bacterium SURF_5]